MSVLSVSDFFASVKDWFVGLPDLIAENQWVLFAIIAVVVFVVALVVVLIVVLVKKSRAGRKSKAVTAVGQLPEQQPAEDVSEQSAREVAEHPAEEVVEQPVGEVVEVQPVEEVAEQSVEEIATQSVEEVQEGKPVEEVVEQPAEPAEPESEQKQPEVAERPVQAQPAAVAEQPAPAAEEPLPAGATVRTVEEEGWYVRTLYNRSFSAKLIQSEQTVKDYYSTLKNELLAYGAVSRVSWKHESFRTGRNTRAKFVIRGKTLCLCLALDAADYSASKYIVDDMSKYVSYAATPLLYRIKNARRCRYAAELIAALFGAENRTDRAEEDFSAIPWQDTASLVEEGLIKVVRTERVRLTEGQAPVEEVFLADEEDEEFEDDLDEMEEVEASAVGSLMGDDYAKSLLAESSVYSDKSRQCIVNVDVLGKYFEEGETVTLAVLKQRVPFIDKRATYVKVLARGVLSKALVVIADDFSLEAVKMIALTGGRAVRNKRK